jgi:hypothetical protein
MRWTGITWDDTLSALQSERKYAAWSAWHYFWPAFDPSAAETKALIDVLNRNPVLARSSNFVSVLGLTPGDGAQARVPAKLSALDGLASESGGEIAR